MEREKSFNSLFRCNNDGEKKLNSFSQLAPIGKRTFILLINLALGENEPKTTFEHGYTVVEINGS